MFQRPPQAFFSIMAAWHQFPLNRIWMDISCSVFFLSLRLVTADHRRRHETGVFYHVSLTILCRNKNGGWPAVLCLQEGASIRLSRNKWKPPFFSWFVFLKDKTANSIATWSRSRGLPVKGGIFLATDADIYKSSLHCGFLKLGFRRVLRLTAPASPIWSP